MSRPRAVETEVEILKTCPVCKESLAKDRFSKGTSQCKECKKKYFKSLYQQKRDERLRYANRYRVEHDAERRAYKKAYYAIKENRDNALEQEKKRRRLRDYGDFAQALECFRKLEEEMRDNPKILSEIPERRYNKRHRINSKARSTKDYET